MSNATTRDPLDAEEQFSELVTDFAALRHTYVWQIAVVDCSEWRLKLWSDLVALGQSLRAIPIAAILSSMCLASTRWDGSSGNLCQASAAHPQLRHHD
ncbi:hypothetical protein [Mycobacterium lepromatosis]|uniref:hypothetical protein n=1 Tax=Mycobacterium lepromatosis TaxID=480418 RepID=UPI001ED991EE|nr:hypothetical protein [Mycobacterium lepromatosis]